MKRIYKVNKDLKLKNMEKIKYINSLWKERNDCLGTIYLAFTYNIWIIDEFFRKNIILDKNQFYYTLI